MTPSIGIIGGSGLYQIDGLTDSAELNVETPFGSPSDTIVSGKLAGSLSVHGWRESHVTPYCSSPSEVSGSPHGPFRHATSGTRR